MHPMNLKSTFLLINVTRGSKINNFTIKSCVIIAKTKVKNCISKTKFLLMDSLTNALRTLVNKTLIFYTLFERPILFLWVMLTSVLGALDERKKIKKQCFKTRTGSQPDQGTGLLGHWSDCITIDLVFIKKNHDINFII